ncbi:MAG: Fur family transcriptional regulator [Alphaproteobacteria bacterium]|jgi:Fur family iron response transcriptional regulator|nr:Fur family transcriptional regulator [Alphaproteobacteria bacterium]MDP6830059.1 Fur family transcriptional regulator [Alphaproteobacteria bacterium]MDP6872563.1 Fur family transcriptional regulator [Alphaproteobacteria bacterium]
MVDLQPDSEVIRNLRAVGLRPTRQRMALARLLFGHGNRHVTAESLYESAQRGGIRVSLATVYNTLHQFTTAGLLRQVIVDSSRSYYDTNVDEHHHFYFEDTGEIADIPSDRINSIVPTDLPDNMELSRVDIVVRLRGTA